MNIKPGDYIKVEAPWGNQIETVEGKIWKDDEGNLRVGGVPLIQTADGRFDMGIVPLTHIPA